MSCLDYIEEVSSDDLEKYFENVFRNQLSILSDFDVVNIYHRCLQNKNLSDKAFGFITYAVESSKTDCQKFAKNAVQMLDKYYELEMI